MASLMEKPGGRWSLQFRLRPRTERQTIALGAMTAAQARGFQERVEALVDAMRADSPFDPSTAKWVAGLSDDLHAKLARVGLITPRDNGEAAAATPLLGRFVDNYIDKRKDVKTRTKIIYGQVRGNLVAFFGATRPMNKITPGDCDDWRLWLESDQGLADNTIRRRCSAARQFFRAALRHKLIAENPFADMKGCSFVEVRDREYFVTRKQAQQVLDACPDAQWRLLFALARFGGLRVPSEPLGLRWQDVNWERERILIHSPKTEGKGKATRVIPLFPELRPFLEEVWEQAEPGATWILTRYRDRYANLRTQLHRIIRKAGLEPWPKPWQNLRSTRETELAETYPIHVVCSWIGNTQAVAAKHYLQTTEEHFQRATAGKPALQTSGAKRCKRVQDVFPPDAENVANARDCSSSTAVAHYPPIRGVRLAGFGPATYGLGNRCSIP